MGRPAPAALLLQLAVCSDAVVMQFLQSLGPLHEYDSSSERALHNLILDSNEASSERLGFDLDTSPDSGDQEDVRAAANKAKADKIRADLEALEARGLTVRKDARAAANRAKADKIRADLEALESMDGTGVEQLRAEKRAQLRTLEDEGPESEADSLGEPPASERDGGVEDRSGGGDGLDGAFITDVEGPAVRSSPQANVATFAATLDTGSGRPVGMELSMPTDDEPPTVNKVRQHGLIDTWNEAVVRAGKPELRILVGDQIVKANGDAWQHNSLAFASNLKKQFKMSRDGPLELQIQRPRREEQDHLVSLDAQERAPIMRVPKEKPAGGSAVAAAQEEAPVAPAEETPIAPAIGAEDSKYAQEVGVVKTRMEALVRVWNRLHPEDVIALDSEVLRKALETNVIASRRAAEKGGQSAEPTKAPATPAAPVRLEAKAPAAPTARANPSTTAPAESAEDDDVIGAEDDSSDTLGGSSHGRAKDDDVIGAEDDSSDTLGGSSHGRAKDDDVIGGAEDDSSDVLGGSSD